ncbi:hypothetical protein [Micromonospora sediminicola]|uniref:hypothetical protein n=1 Tax=Micromonospora sediminicola TaxID=946078 RepID=UPI0037A43B21
MAEVFYADAAELARLTNTFTVDGTPTDPTTVTLVVTDPAGSPTTYTGGQLGHGSAGVYSKDIPCTTAGVWSYVWVGTGAASDAVAGTWTVQSTDLGRLYCTPEELRSRVGQFNPDDDTRDSEIVEACATASRWIDQWCGRSFWRADGTRVFPARSGWRVDLDDVVSVTSVAVDADADGVYETVWTPGDYELGPPNPSYPPRPYTLLRAVGSSTFPYDCGGAARVRVTGVFGWPEVPAEVRQAAAVMATDLLKLGTMAFGVAGYGEYGPVRVRPNPIVEALLSAYRRRPVLVA